jgi:hypothetical protein
VTKSVEKTFGRDTFIIDYDDYAGMVIRKGISLAIINRTSRKDVLIVNLRSSISPNTAASLVTRLSNYFKIELDPCYEFDDNGYMVFGVDASRVFAENAHFLLLGERKPSAGATVVKPKGQYLKHRIN